jgi:hypothetical protein
VGTKSSWVLSMACLRNGVLSMACGVQIQGRGWCVEGGHIPIIWACARSASAVSFPGQTLLKDRAHSPQAIHIPWDRLVVGRQPS